MYVGAVLVCWLPKRPVQKNLPFFKLVNKISSFVSHRFERFARETDRLSYNQHAKSMALMVRFNQTLANFGQQTSITIVQ
jgi:hypothetical protein